MERLIETVVEKVGNCKFFDNKGILFRFLYYNLSLFERQT